MVFSPRYTTWHGYSVIRTEAQEDTNKRVAEKNILCVNAIQTRRPETGIGDRGRSEGLDPDQPGTQRGTTRS
uniref:Uncharacterized protein n=1 Tax=Anguilla anguilla TaxID=7936 RepID=A0A0E9XSK3_ANGAN